MDHTLFMRSILVDFFFKTLVQNIDGKHVLGKYDSVSFSPDLTPLLGSSSVALFVYEYRELSTPCFVFSEHGAMHGFGNLPTKQLPATQQKPHL